ncbi:glycosyltransferase WbuB [Alkalispirochaeta sphaeroplastigenens]|uniref:Glycosyltransferase WbuB n=1 Tax=Alkalispirochaeta sphaeroplastigenens TaxID=1187066 RepID=A0A2S4JG26_9SPIO|nr:glycosyltransferase family 4 protein [Alkalispirochaeta sphaeroplastigenens]POQ98360.1 glycosyltransferase WbuB [Alkalispirochaeta sphaeroplastigenens]
MKITYLHQYFNTPAMSGGTRSYEMARRLVAMGHEVNMITSWRDTDEKVRWFETDESGIKVHWLPVPYSNSMGFSERIRAFLKFAIQSARRAASLESDIVFATSTPLTIALPAVYAARRRRVPMVFEVRDLWPDVPYAIGAIKSRALFWIAGRLERFSYKAATHIIALTPTMRDFISGKGVALSKITSIPNLASLDAFSMGTKRNDTRTKTILYCGNLGPAHGPEFLLELAKIFYDRQMQIKIEVVGGGKLLDRLMSDAGTHGCLGNAIFFHGPLPKKEVDHFYNEADATIMTIADCELLYRHSVQNKFFDSIAAGKPVIANYRGYASELAETMNAGLIVERNNIAAAASKIADFLKDDECLQRMGMNARQLAEKDFDADLLARRLEHVLLSSRISSS